MSEMQEFSLKSRIKQLSNEELKECLSIMDEGAIIPQDHLIYKVANQFFKEVYLVELLRISTQCGIELDNRLNKKEDSRVVPLWQLKQFANTLRMISNTLHSPKRESCLDRNVMRDWNEIVNLIKQKEYSSPTEHIKYYMEIDQIPDSNY